MRVIYKYKVDFGVSKVEMFKGSEILHAECINREFFIWALVNPERKLKERWFQIFATGQHIADYDKKHYHYIETMVSNGFVWHLYEVLE